MDVGAHQETGSVSQLRSGVVPDALRSLPSVVVVSGHYGVGKTNFSMNLALDLVGEGRQVCLVDLDVVNPFFRSSDYPELLKDAGVELLAPEFSQSGLDAPMLSGRIGTEIGRARSEDNRTLIIDVGGDDVGATALGTYSSKVLEGDYAMLYVINAFREWTVDPSEAARLLPEIEVQAKLKATAIVNNSHVQQLTEASDVQRGIAYAHEVARMVDLPVICTAIPVHLEHCVDSHVLAGETPYYVRRLVTTPWGMDE